MRITCSSRFRGGLSGRILTYEVVITAERFSFRKQKLEQGCMAVPFFSKYLDAKRVHNYANFSQKNKFSVFDNGCRRRPQPSWRPFAAVRVTVARVHGSVALIFEMIALHRPAPCLFTRRAADSRRRTRSQCARLRRAAVTVC
jgi:hypothetical protein